MDLPALLAYLQAKGNPLALEAADPQLPGPLRDLLASMPGSALTVTLGSDGLRLDGQILTISGGCAASWPVAGLTGVNIAAESAEIQCTASDQVSAAVRGRMPLSTSVQAPVNVTAQPPAPAINDVVVHGWRAELSSDVPGVSPLDLLLLGRPGTMLPIPDPPGLAVLGRQLTAARAGFGLTFFPGTSYPPQLAFELDVPGVHWVLAQDLLTIDKIGMAASVAGRSWSVAITGQLSVAGVAMELTVSMFSAGTWTATVRPAGTAAFPGLAALAEWVGGSALASRTSQGFTALGLAQHDFDAAIRGLTVRFGWATAALQDVQIRSLLTIGALQLDVVLQFPALTIAGSLRDGKPVAAAAVLSSLRLPADGLPQDLQVTEASFAAQPSAGWYQATLAVDLDWQAGPVMIEQVYLAVSYAAGDGLTGQFGGTIRLGSGILFDLRAAYGGAAAGWEFSGRTDPGALIDIGGLLTQLGRRFGIHDVPAPIASFKLAGISVSYQTGTGAFAFGCEGDITIADTPVSAVITIDITRSGSGHAAAFGGVLTIGTLDFTLDFSTDDSADVLAASYHNAAGPDQVRLRDLVASVSAAAAAQIPAELSVGLTDVKFGCTRTVASSPAAFAIGLDLSARIGLSELPLIGDKLPPGATLEATGVQVLYSSAQISGTAVAAVNELLADRQVMPFPAAGLGAGAALTAQLRIGDDEETIRLGVPPPSRPAVAIGRAVGPAGASTAPASTAPASPGEQGASAWVSIQRTVGVLTVNRVGLLYQHDALLFAIDADIGLGPLGLSLDGLAFGSALTEFRPAFSLDGLGLRYAEGPLEVTGALLRVPDSALPAGVTMQFDGAALVRTGSFALAAIGSWATLAGGQPSLFVFASYDQPIGGPPALFVTGLMAGFGYNRTLALPGQNEVASFPLLLLNQPPRAGQPAPDARQVLDVLEGRVAPPGGGGARQWISPRPGSDWLAAGLVFTSFRLLTSRALLIAEFGDDLVFALLGTSTLQLPQPQDSAQTYVYAELDLAAVVRPAEGLFTLTAVLSPSSYVLTPACHLTGGFAVSAWFGSNPNAGQFVVTLGGYHPAFSPPSYYPSVPRIGFSWAVSGNVSISGSAYFALTPSCAMAGAALNAVFQDGDLSAWFTATADMLVSWRPFFYSARIAVSVGVSYRLNLLFCHKTISLSIGADVTLWGPPTGGIVRVDLWIVSFTVAFGAGRPDAAGRALEWGEFAGLLPPAAAVNVQPVSGLLATIDSTASSSGKKWVVRARDFRFRTQSALPASRLRCGDPAAPAGSPGGAGAGSRSFDGPPVSIRPMNQTGLDGLHQVTVSRGTGAGPADPLDGWSLRPSTASLPESLWGTPPAPFSQTPAAPSASVLAGQLTGYDIAASPPAAGPSRGVIALAEVAVEQLTPGSLPLNGQPVPDPRFAYVPDPGTIGQIAGVAAVAPARGLIRDALALAGAYQGPAGTLERLAAGADREFADAPMRQG